MTAREPVVKHVGYVPVRFEDGIPCCLACNDPMTLTGESWSCEPCGAFWDAFARRLTEALDRAMEEDQ